MNLDEDEKSKRDELLAIIRTSLKKKRLNAIHVFRLADPDERNNVSVISLKNAFQANVPNVAPQKIFQLLKYLDSNRDGFIQFDEYEIFMLNSNEDLEAIKDNDSRVELSQKERSSKASSRGGMDNESAISEVPSPKSVGNFKKPLVFTPQPGVTGANYARNETRFDSDESAIVAKNIGAAIQDQGENLESLFDQMDNDSNGTVPVMIVMGMLKDKFPLEKTQVLAKAVRYMDPNKNGFIHKGDFIAALMSGKFPVEPKQTYKPIAPVIEPFVPPTQSAPAQSKPAQPIENSLTQSAALGHSTLTESQFYHKVKDLKQLLKEQGIPLIDYFPQEEMSVTSVASKLHEALPSLNRKDLVQMLKYIDIEKNGSISRQEYALMVGYDEKSDNVEESIIVGLA